MASYMIEFWGLQSPVTALISGITAGDYIHCEARWQSRGHRSVRLVGYIGKSQSDWWFQT